MSTSKNFTGTYNNPDIALTEFIGVLKALPNVVAGRAQLEKGTNGTPHFQWCVSLSKVARLQSLIKKLKGCHVEVSKNAMAAWRYCGKSDTRIEGPEEFGVPPASKAVKGDTATRNKMILEMGVVKACEEGLIPIEKFKQVKQSVDLFSVMKKDKEDVNSLDSEWHWGPTGTGKSRTVRNKYPDAFIKSNDIWWDGYAGEDTIIIEEMGPKMINGHHMK
jgi:hypothetical protein